NLQSAFKISLNFFESWLNLNTTTTPQYEFGNFCLDPGRRLLLHAGNTVPLTPKEFDTLLVLVSRGGLLVEKEELLKEIWPETFVGEATLAQNVFTLRRALRRHQPEHQYIETVSKHGYRFVADVRELRDADVILEKRTTTHFIAEEVEDSSPSEARPSQVSIQTRSDGEPYSKGQKTAASPIELSHVAVKQTAATLPGLLKRHRLTIAISLSAALAVAAIVYLASRKPTSSEAAFQKMRISMLTTSGRAVRAAISPNGKYVANSVKDGGQESLWLRQVAGGRNLQVVPPADVRYQGVTFSPDNDFIYYVAYEKNNRISVLYKIPLLGGPPGKLLTDLDSAVTFSADGKNIVFVRNDPEAKASYLMVANVNGTQERKLATRATPDFFSEEGTAWSPDGQSVIAAVGRNEFNRSKMDVMEYRVADGASNRLTARQWDAIGQLAWLADGSAILMDAWDSSTSLLSKQIWQLSYPDGQARRVTNDLNSYHGVSISASNGALVTVRASRATSLWIAPSEDIDHATRITSGTGDLLGEVMGLAWTPDERLVYGSNASGGLDVWIMDADGSNQKQLTVDAEADLKPSVSVDGRTIVFVSWRTGTAHIWRMNSDGSNLKQLTNGAAESYPDLSPDGRWIVYLSAEQNKSHIWKVSTEGGEPVQVSKEWSLSPRVSPDGKVVACFNQDESNGTVKIALIPFAGGEPIKSYAVPATVFLRGGLQWKPDGSALTYIDNNNGVSNFWSQPLDASPPKQLTRFTADKIFRFAWSIDGRRLAFERGMEISDTTMIDNFR
ncbi:MAG: winged helix-turn-helix domain-containing protein, partial [Acidobacteriota bacterium]|nr:winged helix-turn-helix domain-containing protein [Acidobacteriota bacterium]